MADLELILPDMSCGHCVKTITATVQGVDAQARLEVDLPAHRVRIASALPREAFEQALADEGYPAAKVGT
jgi:copper chaperone